MQSQYTYVSEISAFCVTAISLCLLPTAKPTDLKNLVPEPLDPVISTYIFIQVAITSF